MGRRAHRLLTRMRQSPAGWGQADLDRLYVAYGFVGQHGARHNVYVHPEYSELRATVPRHTELPPMYARWVVKSIDILLALREEERHGQG